MSQAEIRLMFDPGLEIDAEAFANEWRERPDNIALGSFAVERSGPRTFADPVTILTFVAGVAVGVLPNALWDGIKWTYTRLCANKGKPVRELSFQNVKQPDGTEVTILRIKD